MSGWLPIESHPRGRERFCVAGYDAKRGKWWADGDAYFVHQALKLDGEETTNVVYDGWRTRRATHWQPLPEPPQ